MSAVRKCPECGTELPSGVESWLCPNCLLGQAANGASAEPVAASTSTSAEAKRAGEAAGSFPQPFGGYELLERIGNGGMGIVYRARQISLDRMVAVKVLPFGALATQEQVFRFRTEASTAGSLQHPNIVAIHEVGLWEDRHFLVMDYVEGQTLAEVVRAGPLPPRRAARYVQTIAEAVHYAHEHGILHRDLKPSNVLIDAADQPRITDFGLAKRLESGTDLTLSGQVLGSPQYMPPEQASGRQRQIGRRGDVYALGAILYHLLTGRPPFMGETFSDILPQVANDEPLHPRQLNPAVPADLETVCLKCLEKETHRRYPTALALAEELGRFLRNEPTVARPVGFAGKVWRWSRRKPQVASLAAFAALAVVLGFGGVLWQWRQAEVQRVRAEANEYVLSINVAQQSLKANNPSRALELLNRYLPSSSSLATRHSSLATDPRGFEWRYLWQQCQTEDEAVVGRLPSGIRCLEISPDGRWLVAGSELGMVKVWNLTTQEEIMLAPAGGVMGFAAFSPDSSRVVFTDQSLDRLGRFAVWNIQTRQLEAPVVDAWPVGSVGFSPDGTLLGYGANSQVVKTVLVDFATRQPLATCEHLTALRDNVHGFDGVVTPDGRYIIFSENDPDRRIGCWDWRAESHPQYFPAHREAITAMALSPDGGTLATAAGPTETEIKLWEVPSFRLLGDLVGHESWVAGLKFSPDGRTLASGGVDRTIRLWDVPTRTMRRVFRRLPDEIWRVCFSPDGQTLYSGSSSGTIRQWSLDVPRSPSGFRTNHANLEPVGVAPNGKRFALAFAPDGQQFAGIHRGTVCLGEVEQAGSFAPVPELGTNNLSLLFSSDGQTLFAGTRDGEVQIWSLAENRLLSPLRLPDQAVLALCADTEGHILVTAQWDARLMFHTACRVGVWRGRPWQEQKSWTFPSAWPCLAVSPDGHWLATGHVKGPVQVWSLSDSAASRTLHFGGRISGVAFSPDGRLLAASNLEGMVKVWTMPTLKEIPKFRAHRSSVQALAFSPDSRRLATAGDGEEAVKLWDVATWQELISLERPGQTLQQVAFSADGNQLTAQSSKGNLLFWRVPSSAEVAAKEPLPTER